MMIRRYLLLLGVLVVCLHASSCIDGKEEIWLNADGSGRAEFTYEIPSSAASLKGGAAGIDKLIGNLLESQPNATHSAVTENGRLKVTVQIPFKSPQELENLAAKEKSAAMPESFKHFVGTINLKQSGRNVEISRTVNPGRGIPGSAFIPKSQLKGRKLSYIVHLPVAAAQSNATRTEDQNHTLIWEVPLAKALRGPITTEFSAVIPIPKWLIATAASLGSVLVIITIFGIRRILKRKSFHPRQTH